MHPTTEFEQAQAHFAARLHSEEFKRHHPEYLAYKDAHKAPAADLTASLHPVMAAAFLPLLAPRTIEDVLADAHDKWKRERFDGGEVDQQAAA